MADTNEKIILSVQLDYSDSVKKSATLADQIKTLTSANKDLKKSGQETSTQYIENSRQVDVLKKQLQQLATTITESIKAQNAQSGSLNQLQAEVVVLRAQYYEMSEFEREFTEQGKEVAKMLLDKTEKLKAADKAVGDNRRNVGNYTEAIGLLSGRLSGLIKTAGEYKEVLDKNLTSLISYIKAEELSTAAAVSAAQADATAAAAALEKATAEVIAAEAAEKEAKELVELAGSSAGAAIAAEKLAQAETAKTVAIAAATAAAEKEAIATDRLATSQVAAANATSIGTRAMQVFKVAIAATGIGVLLIALVALVAVFTRFQPVVDKIEQIMGGLAGVVDVLVGRFISLGKAIIDIVTLDFEGAANNMSAAVDNLGNSLSQAYHEGEKLVKMQQELDDINRDNIVTNSELSKQIDQLLLKSKNRTLSEQERIALIDEAAKKETQMFENNKRAAAIELDIAEQKYAAAERNQTLNDEIEDARANAIAKMNNLESESINLQEKLQNRRDALIQAELEARQKLYEQMLKSNIASAEADLILLRSVVTQALQLEIDLLEKKKNAELANAELTAGEKKKIEAQFTADVRKLMDDDTKAYKDKLKAEGEALAKAREEQYKSANTLLKNAFTDQETLRNEELAKGLLTQKEFDNQQLLAKQTQIEAQIALDQQYYKDTTDLELQAAQGRVAIQKKAQEDKAAINKAAEENEKQTQAAINNIAEAAKSVFGEQTLAFKSIASAQALINTYSAATAALAPPPLGLGPIFGPIAAIAATATGLANVAKINGINIGGKAAGGGDFMTKGPTWLLVGDNPGGVEQVSVKPISGKGTTAVAPGGNLVAMAGGGTLTAFGGYAERRGFDKGPFDMEELAKALAALPAPILKVSDLEKTQEAITKDTVASAF